MRLEKVRIILESIGEVNGAIDLERNPKTARAILEALPIKGSANRWGDEVYFETPVEAGKEHGQIDVGLGDIAYWPEGNALCIFFGPTPMSSDAAPRAYSPVNIVGKVMGDIAILRKVRSGSNIAVVKG